MEAGEAIRKLFTYHAPTPDDVVQIAELSALAKCLADKIAAIKTEGPHSVSGDFRREAMVSLKNAVMQANTAIIIGRVVREASDKEKLSGDRRTHEQIIRDDIRQALNHVTGLADAVGRGVRGDAPNPPQTVRGEDTAADRAPTQKEIEAALNARHPDLVIKVRRRKSR